MTKEELTHAVGQVFATEKDDAASKIGNSYWGPGSRNVGYAVLSAVVAARSALLAKGVPTMTLAECRHIVEATRIENGNDPDDEDGFGGATYHGLIRGIDALIDKAGADAGFSVRESVGRHG